MTKRLILSMAFLSILFCGCKNDEPVVPTTIQIANGFKSATTTTNSVSFDAITVYCYNSLGDLIQTVNYPNDIYCGSTSNKIEIMSNVEKVRVSVIGTKTYYDSYYETYKSYSINFYVMTYFYLTKAGNMLITIDNNTAVQGNIWQ